jgi:uncharacterized RDD family membrane protein YckC
MGGALETTPSRPSPIAGGMAAATPGGAIRRMVATLADMVLVCSLCVALALPVVRSVDWSAFPGRIEEATALLDNRAWVGRASGVVGMWIALWWCYFVVGWGLLGATPGKWLVGLRVIDHRGRFPIGVSRAVMRLCAYSVSSLTLGFGHLILLFRRDRCALHDLLAGTRVVRRPRRTSTGPPAS